MTISDIIDYVYRRHRIDLNKPKFDIATVNEMISDAIEKYSEQCKPLDDGQEGKGQAEDYLKASVGKSLNIDFSKEQWYIDWWMLLDPQPSFRCIIRAMEAYKTALPVADGEGEKVEEKCPRCKGEGEIEKNIPSNEGAPEMDVMVGCPECGGTGIENP